MPITFACDCGKQLKTGDENAGKRVKCPACGQAVAVPAPGAAKASAAGVVRFGCDCGKQLQARPELAGKRVKCPGCGAELTVPGAANGIQANKPAAKKSDAAVTAKSPRPKPMDDEDEPPRKGKRRFEEDEADGPRKARHRVEDEEEDEEDEDELPRRGKKKASKGLSVPLVLGITAAVILLLTGAGIGAYFLFFRPDEQKPIAKGPGPDKGGEQNQQQGGPVADLDFVPRDAVGFGTVRVGKVWNDPNTKEQLKLAEPFLKEPMQQLQAMEQQIGLTLGDVERATGVVLDTEGEAIVAIISTSKPYDQSKILGLLPPNMQKVERQGKTYHANQQGAIYFPSDRLVVLGTARGVEQVLARTAQPNAAGPLAEAIKLAGEDHDLVVGVNPPADKVDEMRKSLPEEVKPYEPLLDAQTVSVTMSGTKDLRMQVILAYADEGKAAKARDAAVAGLAFGRTMLAAQKKEMAKDPEAKEMLKALEPAEKALENLSPQLNGKVVSLGLKLDQATLQGVSTALLPAVMKVRGAANNVVNANNLKQLAIAMHNYTGANGRLPTGIRSKDGRPLLSWRVELLPYLEQDELYKQFKLDEPWDSPHNKALLAKMPKAFADPERPAGPGMTFYQVFSTPPGQPYNPALGAPFPDPTLRTPPGAPAPGPRMTSFTDGTSNTILIVEALGPVPWTKPQDLPYNPKGPIPQLGNPAKQGFFVAMADGAVLMVPRTVSEPTLRSAITPADGKPLGPDWPKP